MPGIETCYHDGILVEGAPATASPFLSSIERMIRKTSDRTWLRWKEATFLGSFDAHAPHLATGLAPSSLRNYYIFPPDLFLFIQGRSFGYIFHHMKHAATRSLALIGMRIDTYSIQLPPRIEVAGQS